MLQKGKPLHRFSKKILSHASSFLLDPELGSWARQLTKSVIQWNILAARLMVAAASNRDIVGSASVDFLMYSGYVVMGHFWLLMAEAAQKGLKKNPQVHFPFPSFSPLPLLPIPLLSFSSSFSSRMLSSTRPNSKQPSSTSTVFFHALLLSPRPCWFHQRMLLKSRKTTFFCKLTSLFFL
jgi:hypothetical protein